MSNVVSSQVCAEFLRASRNQTPNAGGRWLKRKASFIILSSISSIYLFFSIRVLLTELSGAGTLTFPLDDTYITMALAKNLAFHGVLGISATRFASATSSPGFLLLLAGIYRLASPTVWSPLALSLIFGLLALFMAQRLLAGAHWGIQFITLLAIVYFKPLHIVGLLGMEHTLHLLLVLAFLHLAGNGLAGQKSPSLGLMLLASFMVSVRYESLFMIAVAGLLFVLQRQVIAAARLGIAAVVPVGLYASISVLNGCYWLPHSVALKGLSAKTATRAPVELVRHFENCLIRAPYIGALLGIIVILLTIPHALTDRRIRGMLGIVFGGTLLHLFFADVGWVYRYEAYLIGATIATIGCAIPHVRISHNGLAIGASLIFAVVGSKILAQRTVDAETTLPYRSTAVYSQQVQMARFLSRFEEGVSVAANDVGAINYYANIDCLDLVGLGYRDVFWLKRKGAYSTAALAKLAQDRKVQIAVVYDSWFSIPPLNPFSGPPLPLSWIRVARWRTPYGAYLGGDTVSFYATNPTEAAKLKSSLASFTSSLPAEVQVLDE